MPEPRSAPVTVPVVRASKRRDGHPPLVMVTAYDAPSARIADAAGVDMILVGDSVANNVLGYDDTLQVTVADMVHHTAAVARARPRPLVVADLPWMSYHLEATETVRNAAELIRAGAQAVKLEGGADPGADGRGARLSRDPGDGPPGPHAAVGQRHGRLPGPGPDRRRGVGPGRRRQGLGRSRLLRDGPRGSPREGGPGAHRVPRGAHHRHRGRARLRRPGARLPRLAGPQRPTPKFVRRYAELADAATAAVAAYAADVRSGAFPADAEVYH